MNKQKELKERLYKFAIATIKLVRTLPKEFTGIEIGRQLLRSGTSIAANYEEATAGFSKADFVYKLSISFKESKESNLWLRLLKDSGMIKSNQTVDVLIKESEEIANILGKSVKTSKANM